jgi:hypothetical protein
MWPFNRKQDLIDEALQKHLDKDFLVVAAWNDAPPRKDLEDFEQIIGFRLPEDFRNFSCSKLGGLYVEAKETVWPRPKKYEAGPFWSFLYGFFVYSFSSKAPEWMSIQRQTEQFRSASNTTYVPCLKISMDADIFCLDGQGMLRRWEHETGEAPLQNKTFSQLVVQEIVELRKRKDQKVAESKNKQVQ